MPLPLSILDLIPIASGSDARSALHQSFELARFADAAGFHRYWFAEHHNTAGLASASPEIVIALVAHQTSRLRVGAGGIMLPNHSPLRVAEHFLTLEALYPGRIDLGLGRAPGTDQLTALALRRSVERLTADDFPAEVQELQAYAGEAPFPEDVGFERVIAMPANVRLPPLWLLSSSGYGARMAAQLGRPMAFAHHFSPEAAAASMRLYRDEFRPSRHLSNPYAMLTVAAVCADTEERAEALAKVIDLMWIRFRRGERGPLPSVEEAAAYRRSAAEEVVAAQTRAMLAVGTPDQVKRRLESLATEMQADELMISTHIGDPAERRKSYELLFKAFR